MKDEPLKTCPESACQQKKWGKGQVKREIGTGAGLIFKGSGFYITDYRSENYKSGAKTDSTSAGESAASPAKAEAAPASAPATPKTESSGKSGTTKGGKAKAKSGQ